MADDDLRKRLVDAASSLAPERVVDPVPIAERARRSHRRRGTVRAGALVVAALVVGAVGVDRIVGSDDNPKVETSADGFEAGGWERLPDGPLSGRVGAAAVWNGDEVVVVGGSTYLCPPGADCAGPADPPFSDGAAYDPSTREWRSIAPSPAAFYGEGAAVVAGDMYFLVPCAIERFTADDVDACPSTEGDVAFIRYDVDADEWTVLDAPPTGRDYGLEGVGRFVVAYTGSDERGESPDLIFDTESSTWQEIPDDPMPAVFDRTVVSSAGGEAVILIGAPIARGSEPSQERNVVARLDLASRSWAELPPPPGRGYRGWGVDDLVALEPHFGGHGGLLDPAKDTWSELPPGPDVEGWENQIAGVIGQEDAVYTDATGWLLDLSQARWIEISPPDARQTFPFSNVTAVGRDLFLFGGDRWDGGNGELLGDAWIWRAPTVERDSEETTTSGPSGPADPEDETSVPLGTPDVLTVTCTEDTTSVDTESAGAGPSGLLVKIQDEAGLGLVVLLESAETGKSVYVEGQAGHTEIAPGAYYVRCVDLDAPEHMEPAGDSEESQRVFVLAAGDVWTPERDLSCDERASTVGDYSYSGEPDAARRGDPVEPVVRVDAEIRQWLRDTDELLATGYREAAGRRVEVVRGDAVIGAVHLTLGPSGWFVTSTEHCADA